MPSIAKNSAAARLLTRVLESGVTTRGGLARTLGVSLERMEDFLALRERMPLQEQLILALMVEADVPSLARHARQLRSQTLATASMQHGDTIRHAQPPEGWR